MAINLMSLTKDELYKRASRIGLLGRSSMTKDELVRALSRKRIFTGAAAPMQNTFIAKSLVPITANGIYFFEDTNTMNTILNTGTNNVKNGDIINTNSGSYQIQNISIKGNATLIIASKI